MSDFSYLKSDDCSIDPLLRHVFGDVSEKDILASEKKLSVQFPSQLREFYLQIGEGDFRHTADFSEEQDCYKNSILHPKIVADIKLLGYDSGQVMPDVEFEEGAIPFFEIADGAHFFVLYPNSDTPNAVCDHFDGEIIEESFEKFIWRLYYESPLYYMKDW